MNINKLKLKTLFKNSILMPTSIVALCAFSPKALAGPTKNYYSGGVYGGIGLMETRTARFAPDGSFEVGASFINPYRRYFINWQIFPWMEATFRYVDPVNSPNGGRPFDISQGKFYRDTINFRSGGTNLDRGFDVKFKIFSEGDYRPAIALGLQDFIGTGLFEGEYIVASKKIGDFDISFGLGWGRVGSRENFPNPFVIFGDGFKKRGSSSGLGGTIDPSDLFSGSSGFFGGVEYLTPLKGLTLKVEYTGNELTADRDVSPAFVHLRESTPINIGVNYRVANWLDTSIAWERGNSIMLRFALKANFNKKGIQKTTFTAPNLVPRPNIEDYITPNGDGELAGEENGSDKRSGHESLEEIYESFSEKNLEITSFSFDENSASISIECLTSQEEGCEVSEKVESLIFNNTPERIKGVFVTLIKELGDVSKYFISRKHTSHLMASKENGIKANINEIDVTLKEKLANLNNKIGVVEKSKFSLAENGIYQIKLSKNATKYAMDGFDLYKGLLEEYEDYQELNQQKPPDTDTDIKNIVTPQSSFISAAIMRDLTGYGFWGHSVYLEEHEVKVYLSNWPFNEGPKNLGLASNIIANRLPKEIEIITIIELVGSIEKSRVSILRKDLELMEQGKGSLEETWINSKISQPLSGMTEVNKGFVNPLTFPSKSWWLSPNLKQHIGNPDHGILIADMNLDLGGSYSPLPGLTFSAIATTFLFGNLDKITRQSDSKLHHVRSDVVSYLQQGRTSLKQLQASYFQSLAPNWYGRVTAGIFEEMYGGVGAEVLFKPFGEKWTLGAEINWVKQRDFNQLFRFRNFNTITGHATLNYELPFYGMRAQISAGRYLAGDRGVTFDISRQFKSGVRVGAFATFTNVSAADFGEGSFDKGFYIKIPLELLLTRNSKQSQVFAFRPLTRDGGQRVSVGPSLYDLTNGRSPSDYKKDWDKFYN